MKKALIAAVVALSVCTLPVAAMAAPVNHTSQGIINPEVDTYGPNSFSVANYLYVNSGNTFTASSTTMTVQIDNLSGSVTVSLEKDGNAVSNYNYTSSKAVNFTVTKGSSYKIKVTNSGSGTASGKLSVMY
ncbi:hypothetical protein CIG75_06460 [Tumebacillus algifaecis]|uniref:Peptidase C-terminal archaeal/bacterial domain-containing protein n=1 Tax=Tumebacillus algifaecis TaxID=1214604 RepID=A0A223CZX0_9BACL|nr:hypothetical protein [Tumebacillus algifaecis]ASS74647.1 hypothetical protein CIG75_06460 [Tumebacillus algifaecis]